jgi:hypothetical protein
MAAFLRKAGGGNDRPRG